MSFNHEGVEWLGWFMEMVMFFQAVFVASLLDVSCIFDASRAKRLEPKGTRLTLSKGLGEGTTRARGNGSTVSCPHTIRLT